MGVRANFHDIVMISVIGEIASPRADASPYTISHDGEPLALTRSSGITYNVRSGGQRTSFGHGYSRCIRHARGDALSAPPADPARRR